MLLSCGGMMQNVARRTLLVAAATARALSAQADLAKVFRRRVLYEDNHVLAFDKPAGVLSQGDRTGDPCVADYAKAFLAEGCGTAYANPAHRLDRPVSGCMLVAASSKAATRLTKAFADGRVEKRYLAVVDGVPRRPSAVLVDAMRSPAGGAAKPTACRSLAVLDEEPRDWSAFEVPTGYKLAATSYDVVAQAGGKTLLEVSLPHGGRRHQIRAALSHAGTPICDDVKYGSSKATTGVVPFIGLHASTLECPHPVADRPPIAVAAPVPEIWKDRYGGAIAGAAAAQIRMFEMFKCDT
jgi:23S rRNA pseudouridine1911/1915/1917 synthase